MVQTNILKPFRDVKWCFNASWGLIGLMAEMTFHNREYVTLASSSNNIHYSPWDAGARPEIVPRYSEYVHIVTMED